MTQTAPARAPALRSRARSYPKAHEDPRWASSAMAAPKVTKKVER